MEFGEKIKILRKKKHLTQKQLADKLGITLKAVSNYELKNVRPRHRKTYDLMADVLDADVNYLLTDEDNMFISARNLGNNDASDAKSLLRNAGHLFSSDLLSEEDKDTLFNAIQDAYWTFKIENKKNKEK